MEVCLPKLNTTQFLNTLTAPERLLVLLADLHYHLEHGGFLYWYEQGGNKHLPEILLLLQPYNQRKEEIRELQVLLRKVADCFSLYRKTSDREATAEQLLSYNERYSHLCEEVFTFLLAEIPRTK